LIIILINLLIIIASYSKLFIYNINANGRAMFQIKMTICTNLRRLNCVRFSL